MLSCFWWNLRITKKLFSSFSTSCFDKSPKRASPGADDVDSRLVIKLKGWGCLYGEVDRSWPLPFSPKQSCPCIAMQQHGETKLKQPPAITLAFSVKEVVSCLFTLSLWLLNKKNKQNHDNTPKLLLLTAFEGSPKCQKQPGAKRSLSTTLYKCTVGWLWTSKQKTETIHQTCIGWYQSRYETIDCWRCFSMLFSWTAFSHPWARPRKAATIRVKQTSVKNRCHACRICPFVPS